MNFSQSDAGVEKMRESIAGIRRVSWIRLYGSESCVSGGVSFGTEAYPPGA